MQLLLKKLREEMPNYASIPFWSWNDKLESAELKKQIHWMKNMGIGGFFMHARSGLKTEYLSEEWMNCIKVCCEEAEKLGMQAWAYDENGWPSGFVGGKLLENEENRDRYLEKQIGKYDSEANVSYLLDGDRLVRVNSDQGEGMYLNLYIQIAASTVDILNPKVVEQFLTQTHEKYHEFFGEDFSKKLKGFFTDEPQYYRWNTPYTPVIAEYYKEQYSEDIMDKLGLLFVEKEGYQEFRYRYYMCMQHLMLVSYAKQIYDWCEEHDVKLTGHYIEESSLGFQNVCCGGVMPFYQYMHMPGIDWLGRETSQELPIRQLSSVASQMGKEHAITETFGCCGWDVTPAQLRRIGGFQYVNGVSKMCLHLLPYSEAGERKRDYPEHFTPNNPWISEHFKAFNDYFTRLGYLIGNGKEDVKVAMLHPQRSSYLEFKREDGNLGGEKVQALDVSLKQACRILSSRCIAYHFLDETLMEEHGFVSEQQIGCGKCTYDYLVLPRIHTMGKHTEHLIRQFVKNGGNILLLEATPEYLEGQHYVYDYLESNCTLDDIELAQPFRVKHTDTELYYTYRQINGKPFLYVQNDSDTESFIQTFRFTDEIHSFIQLDLLTMETKLVPLTVKVHENEGVLLFPTKQVVPEKKEVQEISVRFCNAEVDFDMNYMTMNTLRYSKDGVYYSEPMYRSVLYKKLLKDRYNGKLWLRYEFEVTSIPKTIKIISEKDSVERSFVNGHPLAFHETCTWERGFRMADIAPFVQEGWNVYEVETEWHQSEETYYALFGEGVTESLKNSMVYDTEIEAVYLCGKFGVYSHAGFEEFDEKTVCSHDFYIGDVPRYVTELVTDGFPFFRGKITLRQNVFLDSPNKILNLKGNYLTAKVKMNGQEIDSNLFDRRVNVSKYACIGENLLEVEYTISNRNFFGPFHCVKSDEWVSPTLFELCDLPRSEQGNLRYRLQKFYY